MEVYKSFLMRDEWHDKMINSGMTMDEYNAVVGCISHKLFTGEDLSANYSPIVRVMVTEYYDQASKMAQKYVKDCEQGTIGNNKKTVAANERSKYLEKILWAMQLIDDTVVKRWSHLQKYLKGTNVKGGADRVPCSSDFMAGTMEYKDIYGEVQDRASAISFLRKLEEGYELTEEGKQIFTPSQFSF